ncbi:MAG TPA: sialidase family protein, partial [Bacteroidales bacterium]|nr:sialidase family protein [Bacteroidales bacterium]
MKHKILLFLFAGLLVSFNTQAQDFWKLIPFPDSLGISAVTFNSQGDIYVTTGTDDDSIDDGVLRSSDQGQTWEVLYNNSYFAVGPIAVNDSGHIYIGVTHRQYGLRASYDNGNSWSIIQHPALGELTKIICVSTDTILVGAAKSGGVLLMLTPDRCITWDTLFSTSNHTSETISDIAIAPDGTIYIGLMCFMEDMGGVYKSTDNGITWEYVGFHNNQVSNIELNAEGDLYVGVFGSFTDLNGGLYVIRNGSATIDTCLYGPSINGLVVNTAGHIYASIAWTTGIFISKDDGETFEIESSGLPIGPMGRLYVDQDEYVYAKTDFSSSLLYRTVEPTITDVKNKTELSSPNLLVLYPNPATDRLTGRLTRKGNCDGRYRLS